MSDTHDTAVADPEVQDTIADDQSFDGDDDPMETQGNDEGQGEGEDEDGAPTEAPDETGMTYRPPEVSSIQLGEHFQITPRGLSVLNNPTFEDRASMGATLSLLSGAIQLALGDFINDTEKALGEEASQILDVDTGWAESTLKTAAWVAKNVKVENRLIPPLAWGHLQVVAALVESQQKKWLGKASVGDGTTPWSISKLKTELKAAKEGGEKNLSFYVVVNAGSQAMQIKLAARLEAEGFIVVTREGTKLQRDKVAKNRRRDAGKSRVSAKAAKAEFKSFPKTKGVKKRGRGRPRKG